MSETKPITDEDLKRLDAATLATLKHQAKRISELMTAVAEMYQYAGATDAPVEILDNLSALANGKSAPHPWDWKAPDSPNDLRATIAQQAARLEAAERTMKSLGRHNRALVEASKAQAQQIETARDNIDQYVDRIAELERLLMIERGRNDDLLSRNKAQAARIAELERELAEVSHPSDPELQP